MFYLQKVNQGLIWSPHSSGQLNCQRTKWNWRPLVFLFDYSWGYFPLASHLALVKCFMKSAFRVDLRSIFADNNNPTTRQSSWWPPNNSHTLGYRKYLVYEYISSDDEAWQESLKQVSCQRTGQRGYGLWWRYPCALTLFLLLVVGDWNRAISGNVTTKFVRGVILLRAFDHHSALVQMTGQ